MSNFNNLTLFTRHFYHTIYSPAFKKKRSKKGTSIDALSLAVPTRLARAERIKRIGEVRGRQN